MTPKIKYAVFPGWIRSRNDGERHYINAPQLMRFYGVNPQECIVIKADQDERSYGVEYVNSLYPLYPAYNYYERIAS